MQRTDLAIVGGGIVGLATAWRFLQRFPGRTAVVLEKEARVGAHQSGHNSGVLHTGIYYRPGSLRAALCRAGKEQLQRFCDEEHIPYKITGKVIVAVDESEIGRLEGVFERGQANGVACSMIGPEQLRELEPAAAGVRAIHVPEAGIIDYVAVCERLAQRIRDLGGEVRLRCRVTRIEHRTEAIVVRSGDQEIKASLLTTCGGLHADRLTALSGQKPAAPIIPFRGEFYLLRPEAEHLCRGLIYPTPDPRFPFLGVHFTRVIQGGVECGPNAVLAFAREGYRKTDINLRDLAESLTDPGFLRLAMKYWRTGAGEMWRSFSKRAFVRSLQRLVPDITAADLSPAPSGVRAQALSRDGALIDDFVFQESERVINVGNAPSPAATSSLQIGNAIVDKIAVRMNIQGVAAGAVPSSG
ncbi:MAG: L-2-hydroxyglutarate oxidase [Planctomyces sp.]|nr:L-2-hydroxyglutarate oxidase [Planctomyces sp.]